MSKRAIKNQQKLLVQVCSKSYKDGQMELSIKTNVIHEKEKFIFYL